MSARKEYESILVLGSGPIRIGQACEFDYSGSQAIKALKEEGIRVVLINSNPATIMTDPNMADATYIEPITTEFIEKVIAKERPNAILPTLGGQTALNESLLLNEKGILSKYGVEMLGAHVDIIKKAEDRLLFRQAMEKIGLDVPLSRQVSSLEEALEAIQHISLPAVLRPSFTLGGEGGSISYNMDEYKSDISNALQISPVHKVLVEESILGWKEYEMEVIRDKMGNCIIVCSIENVDPMGVHTGDSITVAPALTLTDKELQNMRDQSIAVLREIGVTTGGANVQFAVHPESGRMVVIEMNPRVSRSSALASKATGFPIATIAAKLAIGYTLDELPNYITKTTPASFEPTIDYVAVKIPRFNFDKFPKANNVLTTTMKSIGEVLAFGRSFKEAMHKALCSLEQNLSGFMEVGETEYQNKQELLQFLSTPTAHRVLYIAQCIRQGFTVEEVVQASSISRWFVAQIADIVYMENTLKQTVLPLTSEQLRYLKAAGFSDERIAYLTSQSLEDVIQQRRRANVLPQFRRIDTCAGEFKSYASYMYSSYEYSEQLCDDEVDVQDKDKIIIIGSGPNRIGQGIEFDFCCTQAVLALREIGIHTIMINCNPETVSTDYDTSDRLYFEPLNAEYVLAIIEKEMTKGKLLGCILQFGGQTPLNLAPVLEKQGIPILGTPSRSIDLTENRRLFQEFLTHFPDIFMPKAALTNDINNVFEKAQEVGFPVLVRPSYVLGGRAMYIAYNKEQIENFMFDNVDISEDSPILIDSYLENATEVDVDAVCDGHEVFVAAIMEHIEEAGIHSGDSACSLPPFSVQPEVLQKIESQTRKIALALNVVGLVNIQFAVLKNEVYMLEVNPRASRTVPFVSKSIGLPLAKIAARISAGKLLLKELSLKQHSYRQVQGYRVKEAVFPFDRFPECDSLLGPEMRSTGEVMGVGETFGEAFYKSQLSAFNYLLPIQGTVFISVKNEDKNISLVTMTKELVQLGFAIFATKGTANFLSQYDIKVETIFKVNENRRPHVIDHIVNRDIHLIINTNSANTKSISDSFSIRQSALRHKIPYSTTISGGQAIVKAIVAAKSNLLDVYPIQDYNVV